MPSEMQPRSEHGRAILQVLKDYEWHPIEELYDVAVFTVPPERAIRLAASNRKEDHLSTNSRTKESYVRSRKNPWFVGARQVIRNTLRNWLRDGRVEQEGRSWRLVTESSDAI